MPLALWKRSHDPPAGAMPGGFFTKIALLVLGSLLVGVLVFDFFSSDEPSAAPQHQSLVNQTPADHQAYQNSRSQVDSETQRLKRLNAAKARDELRQKQQQRVAGRPGSQTTTIASAGEASEHELTEEEWKLQQAFRLEEIERRQRSLRSEPLVKTLRADTPSAARPQPAASPASAPASQQSDAEPQQQRDDYFDNLKATLALFNPANNNGLESGDELVPPQPPAPPPSSNPTANRDYQRPVRVSRPADPAGWERIYEGSFLEAVLVTQLSGDFPGPVLAQVSVPFYSRDRQQVLIPRGARLVGTAQQVTSRDQGRLAVGFHRLIFPDGRWITLPFLGLNQLGESGLKDRINRHYLSLFAATGAVGVLSGLTLQGADPYRGGVAGFRAGAGQGLGQAAMRIMDRFLNRLPTITIRAGHRLRIWFTSDVLIPRGSNEARLSAIKETD